MKNIAILQIVTSHRPPGRITYPPPRFNNKFHHINTLGDACGPLLPFSHLFFMAILLLASLLVACVSNPVAIRKPASQAITKPEHRPDSLCQASPNCPMVAIVIDDIGRRPHDLTPFLDLPIPVTFSVFPGLPLTSQALKLAKRAKCAVFGHIPMEPINASVMEPDLTFLLTHDSHDQIRTKLNTMLNELPGIVGINNHMGSKFTQDTGLMQVVFSVLKQRNLYFLDSRTTRLTVAEATARHMHIRTLRRDVFLDDTRDPLAVATSMDKLVKKAEQQGWAVAIGHPFPQTAAGITRWLDSSAPWPVRFVCVASLFSCRDFSRDRPCPATRGE